VALHDHLAALAGATSGGTPPPPGTTTTGGTTTTSGGTTTTSGKPPPPPKAKLALRITRLHVAGRKLTASGSLARGFSGNLTVVVITRSHDNHGHTKRTTLHTHARATGGHFSFTLRLPKGAALQKVTVSFTGGRGFAAGSSSKS